MASLDTSNASPNGNNDDGNRDTQPVVNFIIKFSDASFPDLVLPLTQTDLVSLRVSTLRRQIRAQVVGNSGSGSGSGENNEGQGRRLANRRLRLIHAGRVLNEQVDLVRDVAKLPSTTSVASGGTGEPKRVYVHCSIGDILTAAELAREAELDQGVTTGTTGSGSQGPPAWATTGPEPRGFDRLRSAGFSDGDVAALRAQFSSLHGTGTTGTDIPNANNEEELTRLEEQWISTGVLDAPPEGSPLSDDYLEELVGLLAGMFLGILAVVFLKEQVRGDGSSAGGGGLGGGGGVFSRRQRRSVLAGVAINVSFALVRMFN